MAGLGRGLVITTSRSVQPKAAPHCWLVSRGRLEALIEHVLDPARSRHEVGTLLDLDVLREALVRAVGYDRLLIVPQEALRDGRAPLSADSWNGWVPLTMPWSASLRSVLDRRANVRSLENRWKLRRPTTRARYGVTRDTFCLALARGPRATSGRTCRPRSSLHTAPGTAVSPCRKLPLEQPACGSRRQLHRSGTSVGYEVVKMFSKNRFG